MIIEYKMDKNKLVVLIDEFVLKGENLKLFYEAEKLRNNALNLEKKSFELYNTILKKCKE